MLNIYLVIPILQILICYYGIRLRNKPKIRFIESLDKTLTSNSRKLLEYKSKYTISQNIHDKEYFKKFNKKFENSISFDYINDTKIKNFVFNTIDLFFIKFKNDNFIQSINVIKDTVNNSNDMSIIAFHIIFHNYVLSYKYKQLYVCKYIKN